MSFKNVIAFVREESCAAIVKALQDARVQGFSVSETRGYGAYSNSFSVDGLSTCARIDVMVPEERADDIATLIMDVAYTGLDGDGLIAIHSMDKVLRIKEEKQQALAEV